MIGPRIDRAFIVRTLRDLVRIDSVNPDLVPGAAGEAAIAGHLARVLADLGLEVAVHEVAPGRPNVVGRLSGSGRGRSLMLNAHVDTVGVDGMPEPFGAAVDAGRMYGRGTYDMKGGLAAAIGAVKALVDAGRPNAGDVLIAAVADEEYASLGTQDLVLRYRPDGAVVTEPTELDVCLAHKGFVWLEIETRGRAAHGSRPDLGVDANIRMGRVLALLEELSRELDARPAHPLLGHGSLHAATIRGGEGLSTYSPACLLHVERRTMPGETATSVLREIQERLDRLSAADPTFEAAVRLILVRDAFEVAGDAPLVQAVTEAASAVLGRPARHVGQMPWMDAALLAAAGVETVVMGPIGAGAHAREEWVDLESVHAVAATLASAAIEYATKADGSA